MLKKMRTKGTISKLMLVTLELISFGTEDVFKIVKILEISATLGFLLLRINSHVA